eukprot:12948055-Alexandrium_andersonii.AAC.1
MERRVCVCVCARVADHFLWPGGAKRTTANVEQRCKEVAAFSTRFDRKAAAPRRGRGKNCPELPGAARNCRKLFAVFLKVCQIGGAQERAGLDADSQGAIGPPVPSGEGRGG